MEHEIREIGSYLETDADGFLINPASKDKISNEWEPIIGDIVSAYLSNYGEKLHSVYVRGSVAKGQAVIGISDLDTFSYVNLKEEKIDRNWMTNSENELLLKYPFAKGIEFGVDPVETAYNDRLFIMQSVCVYGDDLGKILPRIKIGKELLGHVYSFSKNLESFDKWLLEEHSSEDIKIYCVWLMKRVLRTGLELTIESHKQYTRDLYPSYKVFSKCFPEKDSEMKEVLYLAINPTDDLNTIIRIRNSIGKWIADRADKFKK
ncbi:MAG: hypothetical protein ABL917_04025 [Parcubacteria group bacterium]